MAQAGKTHGMLTGGPDRQARRPAAFYLPLDPFLVKNRRPGEKVRLHSTMEDEDFTPLRVDRKDGYIIVYDLPVVDEHPVYDDEGKFVTQCDERMLHWIASNNNKRIRETGDEAPFTIGHTVDDAPETEQPPIVGYGRDFYVYDLVNPETMEPTGRKAIYVKQARFPEQYEEELRKHPRRSVEIWFDKDPIIDPIALLGATTPERDLGLMKLSRNGKRIRAQSVGLLKKNCLAVAA